jgi:hypothetical protein
MTVEREPISWPSSCDLTDRGERSGVLQLARDQDASGLFVLHARARLPQRRCHGIEGSRELLPGVRRRRRLEARP